ncbi:uncharacterized protein LY79DRAFT_563669 [Colletotrichum navitas]|uniref:Secreted protein n=1 Tax=Colletotrichum navitas TaxID=681940 RepID=A0AAD8V1F9_9PEZI|nr:uncharacterized protein LY79DRAFT_563669 [Colletotrichum navitas]KAK1579712.1 hypothetical protein LY79DRAFT_563669 [Colletotrichum navitas]
MSMSTSVWLVKLLSLISFPSLDSYKATHTARYVYNRPLGEEITASANSDSVGTGHYCIVGGQHVRPRPRERERGTQAIAPPQVRNVHGNSL